MMTRFLQALVAVVAVAGALPAQVAPQMQAPPKLPSYSPYLNLLNRNNSTYQNYFSLVQPQQQAQDQFKDLQQQLQGLQNTPVSVYSGTGSELITGKQVGYFTHRSYFMNMGGVPQMNYLTGQYGNAGTNTVNQVQPRQPFSGNNNNNNNNNIMPFRR